MDQPEGSRPGNVTLLVSAIAIVIVGLLVLVGVYEVIAHRYGMLVGILADGALIALLAVLFLRAIRVPKQPR